MKQNIYQTISSNIKKFRKLNGYTIKQLSILTKLPIEYIKKIETTGVDKDTTLEELILLTNILNVKIIDLISDNKKN